MDPALETVLAKARSGQPLTQADKDALDHGVARATNSPPGKHRETITLIKARRLTIIEDDAGSLAVAELRVVPVTRNGTNFPYTGYCLVDPSGDSDPTLCGRSSAEAWRVAERRLRKPQAELEYAGWRVVLADFPDA